MIVTTLFGGLGNQMFIYAAAKALSLRNNVPLVINCSSGFKNDVLYQRNFELNCFHIKYEENNLLSYNYSFSKYIRFLSRKVGFNVLFPTYKFLVEKKKPFHFEREFLTKKMKNVYLEGYWQSELYFNDFQEIIRKDFSFKREIITNVKDKETNIKESLGIPVALGVRLYQECNSSAPHAITNRDFYHKAMQYIVKRIPNAVFYVFTQVPNWVEKNIDTKKYSVKILTASNKPAEDLYLMTLFKYHIISNSSYYWWGAWLSNSSLVISNSNFPNIDTNPKKWVVV